MLRKVMNKKRNLIISAIIFFILITMIVYFFLIRNQPITNFFNNDASKINKITMINGNNGHIVSTEDIEVIGDISKYLSNIKLNRIYFDGPSTGWTYRLSFYENGVIQTSITFLGDNLCIIGDKKYSIQKSADGAVESFFNKVNVTEVK